MKEANPSENLLVHFRQLDSLRAEAISSPSVDLNPRQLCLLELLLNRAYYPLPGFMGEEDYQAVLATMRLADGTVWPLPICLDVDATTASRLEEGMSLALNDEEGFMLALMHVTSVWKADKPKEALALYGIAEAEAHPGVKKLYTEVKEFYVGGPLVGLHLPLHHDFQRLRLTPADAHRFFFQNGWRHIVGYHASGYLHRQGMEMLRAAAGNLGAYVFLQLAIDHTNTADIRHYAQVNSYQHLIKRFPLLRAKLTLAPVLSRLAGPREALLQAIISKNYGCSHYLVADDHADPFANTDHPFYPLQAAQELVREHEAEVKIVMVPLPQMVYVKEQDKFIETREALPEQSKEWLSPGDLHHRLEHDLQIPAWFSYPEVLAELRAAYPPRKKQGVTVFFTGLSGSGKSTIAKFFLAKMLERRERPVTLLDGDVVRKNLSKGLGFSSEHRHLNVTRIGFVASEITKNGGIAICAPIAPYLESREANRELISQYGGYVEVYVATSLNTCSQRDRKGLYAKAKAGLIKNVTGVDDPYIPPLNPEITIETESTSPAEASEAIIRFLEENGYLGPQSRAGVEARPQEMAEAPVETKAAVSPGAEPLAASPKSLPSYLHLVGQ